jgi:putative membrane protein
MRFWIKACIFLAVIAHLGFLVLQMFLWQSSLVQETLLGGFTIEQKAEILAHNQGLYNGFLGAGLLWGLFAMNSKTPEIKIYWVAVFFLVCALIAGIYGSVSLGSPKAFILQSLPGLIALPLIWFTSRSQQQDPAEQKLPTS